MSLNNQLVDADRLPNLKVVRPANFKSDQHYLIQFDRPLDSQVRRELDRAGIRLTDYLPGQAYIAKLEGVSPEALSRIGGVYWVGEYREDWKLDPAIGHHPFQSPGRLAKQARGERVVWVTLFQGASAGDFVRQLDQQSGAKFHYTEHVAGNDVVSMTVPAGWERTLVRRPEVQFIQEAPELTLRNDTVRWIVQSNVAGVTPFYAHGLTGIGQIVGILDSKLDSNHCSFFDSANPIGPLHRKIVAYNTTLGAFPHGTHVSGIVAGDNGSFDDRRGVAYLARIAYGQTPPIDETSAYSALTTHHNQGARIHTNSWGNDATTSYDGLCRGIDAFAYDNEDDLVLFAITNTSSLKNPENAKNLLAVAATQDTPNQENHCSGGTGPTADGRRKPEIYAPGCSILSAQSATACDVFPRTGTSMACPAVAGAALLLRQYFMDGFYPTGSANASDTLTPSGALLKSMLLNSATDMSGASFPGYPGNLEGWGRVLADNSAYFSGDARRLLVLADRRNASGLSTSQQAAFQVLVLNSTQQLRATLVWVDPPASAATGTGPAYINDLDLEVVAPDSTTYLGNVFSGGVSAPGGVKDSKNNVEQVHVSSPSTGVWTVRVNAAAVNVGLQGYALVVTGAVVLDGTAPSIASIAPAEGESDSFVTVTDLAGDNFQNGCTVKLIRAGQPDIDGYGIVVVTPQQITCEFYLASAMPGNWDVVVTNPDTQSATLPGSFHVYALCFKADMNDDGLVDGLDVSRFTSLLMGESASPREVCAGDVAAIRDDQVTLDDVPAFVDCLLSSGCP